MSKSLQRQGVLTRSQAMLSKQAISKNARTGPAVELTQNSSRTLRIRTKPENIVKEMTHFDLSYGPAFPGGRGGTKVTAVLGPGLAPLVQLGTTNAKADALPKLKEARATYPSLGLVAGHLLNARFGGVGDDSKNLTILSASGNSHHKAFDNPVGDAVINLYKLYNVMRRQGVDVSKMTCGIKVTIAVSSATWNTTQSPDKFICKYLICKAELVDYPSQRDLNALPRNADLVEDLLESIVILLRKANDNRPNGRRVENTRR